MTIREVARLNPEMLTLAREARAMTQGELARRAGMAQATLSKYENGLLEASEEHIEALAIELNFPTSRIACNPVSHPVETVCMFHRKRESTSVRDAKRLKAVILSRWLEIQWLLNGVEVEPVVAFPQFDIGEYGKPDAIAALVRHTWRLPGGPIKNLVGAVERAGGIVMQFPFGTRKIDAISMWSGNVPPLFFINTEMPPDRRRLSLAHEIGHAVMHRTARPNQEEEANQFASSFLLPSRDIRHELFDLTLPEAAQLKSVWGVSMQALIRRARDLDQIPEHKYHRLFTKLSKLGYRKAEPVELPSEHPDTLDSLIRLHLNEHGYSMEQLAKVARMNPVEFRETYVPVQFLAA